MAKSATSAVDYALGAVLIGVVVFGFVGIFRRLKLHEAITGVGSAARRGKRSGRSRGFKSAGKSKSKI